LEGRGRHPGVWEARYIWYGLGAWPQFCRGVDGPGTAPPVASADTARGTTDPTTIGTSSRTTRRTTKRTTCGTTVGTTSQTSCDSTRRTTLDSGRGKARDTSADTRARASRNTTEDTLVDTSQRTSQDTSRRRSIGSPCAESGRAGRVCCPDLHARDGADQADVLHRLLVRSRELIGDWYKRRPRFCARPFAQKL